MNLRWSSLPLLAALLAACVMPRPAPEAPAPLAVPNQGPILQEELGVLAAPPAPLQLHPAPPDPLTETRVTLAGSGIPLQEVLHRFVRAAGLTLVVESEVAADHPIDVAVEDLPLRTALRVVLTPLGLFARREETTLVVYAFDTRTWALAEPVATTAWQDTISNRVQTAGTTGTTQPAGTAGTVSTGPAATPQLGSVVELHREGKPQEFWGAVREALAQMVRAPGWVSVNEAAGTITVRERPDRLAAIDRYLAALEGELARQVEVEVKVLEVTLSGENVLGIDWALALGGTTLGVVTLSGKATGALSGVGVSGLPFAATLATTRAEGVIRALGRQGKVRVVSQPRLRLANNQTAAIQVGQVRSFLGSVSSSLVQGGTSQVSATTNSIQDGMTLTLTARILGPMVTLVVAPALTRVTQIRRVEFGQGNAVEAPDLTTRALTTTVRVADGGLVVLGGLINEERVQDRVGLPGLTQLPFLGWLFGAQRRTASQTELVLTLSPTILKAPAPPGPPAGPPPPAPLAPERPAGRSVY